MREPFRSGLFVIAILALPVFGVYVLAGLLDFSGSLYLPTILWLAGFGCLTLNTAHMLVCSLVALWPTKPQISETDRSQVSRTDVLYVVRNESTDLLFTTMAASLAGIAGSNVRLWLLSNSDGVDFRSSERHLIKRLQQKFGAESVGSFATRKNPLRRKHVCIREWLDAHPESCLILICDADTVLPAGSVEKLIRKAEHPDNAGIAVFQSHIRVTDAETRFARMLSHGQEIAQRIFATAHQRVFRRSAYYGSGCLIRAAAYRTLNIPAWVLSHDIWETVALERCAGRIAYCPDVVTFGRFPNNMLAYLRRNRRWIIGTMETFPLLVRPRVPFGTRFLVLLPIYLYLCQPLLLIWIAVGFAGSSSVGSVGAIQTSALIGSGYFHVEMSSCLIVTIAIVFGHRFTQCRSLREIGDTGIELAASIVLCLNCILFDSATVIAALVRRRRVHEWVPAEKQNRPVQLREVARTLWPSTLVGLVAAITGAVYAANWALIASPFLLSFCLGIPAAYWTAQKPQKNDRVASVSPGSFRQT
jgi:membrane glycosyltransferase